MRAAGLGLLAALALAACGNDAPPVTQSFPALHYDYLPKLRLNIGSIQVVDHSLPVDPQDVASSSPVVPAQVLAQMARDRLFAAGTSGAAIFTIDQASLVRTLNGSINGQLAAHLDLVDAAGNRVGFAEARVARQHMPGSDAEDGSATLYALTRDMMNAMNVELEYQVHQSLKPFLLSGAAVPTPVVAQPLDANAVPSAIPPPPALPPATPDGSQIAPTAQAPTTQAPAASDPATPVLPALSEPPAAPEVTPPSDGYEDPAGLPALPPPPRQLSPQPGFLRAPPGM